jgi:predicted alpha/beta hydrolase
VNNLNNQYFDFIVPNKHRRRYIMTNRLIVPFLCLMFFVAGCGGSPVEPTPTLPAETEPVPVTEPTSTPTEPALVVEDEPSMPALPPDAQRIEFQTEDGVALVGYYYPAAVNPAPVVVLMHWAGGDQTDWLYVGMVSWLQNRGAEIPAAPAEKYFDTPYPFPPLPENQSFAVFTFDFRGYGESDGSGGGEEHILDAKAAYAAVSGLEGVDPMRIAGIGASIGADAVADACLENCIGAMSLGPGDYLVTSYSDVVTAMDQAEKPAWCIASEDVQHDVRACNSASGTHYLMHIYPNGGHAMSLFKEANNLNPPIETIITDFLITVFDAQ